MEQARLIDDSAAAGSWNMAVDQALLRTVDASAQPVLRFYRWSPPALSLGYFQAAAERVEHSASRSCDLVRRVTGGGAILHDRELTYSLIVPLTSRWSRDHLALYEQVHASVIDALSGFGIRGDLVGREGIPDSSHRFLCFERRSPGDLVVGDTKICGSAQRRLGRAILQHGSILLARSPLAPELAGIAEVAGKRLDDAELAQILLERLADRLDLAIQPSQLDQSELVLAHEIRQNQFAHADWTFRR
jgi:lipoate-protein ligase A